VAGAAIESRPRPPRSATSPRAGRSFHFAVDDEGVDLDTVRPTSSVRIIDNHFVTVAERVQVTIRKSGYGFHVEGCGEWRPAH
jgi:hypothetical protein